MVQQRIRLRRALLAACEYAQRQRAELNRINVFPVPDGDTGTNLALTAAGVAEELRALDESRLDIVSRQAADAAILGFEGTRRWRALKLWLSWKHVGTAGFARLVVRGSATRCA